MGEPTTPSLEEREKRRGLAFLEVDAVTNDETTPFERAVEKYTVAVEETRSRVSRIAHEMGGVMKAERVTAEQDKLREAREDLELMGFALSQEITMLVAEKRALEAELEATRATVLRHAKKT